MRIAVVIATLGRPEEVGQLLERLNRQTLAPTTVILSVETTRDLPHRFADTVHVIMGPPGLPAQRNRGLNLLLSEIDDVRGIGGSPGSSVQRNRAIDLVQRDCELIAFFDDDFVPSDRALEGMAALFRDNPAVVGATGWVLQDGVTSGGIDYDEALAIVAAFDAKPPVLARIERDVREAYGCNMAFRASAIGETRFDEKLPLYAWQEDVDFAARMAPRGRVVKTNAFAGVHRGVTRGRTSGVRLGFSQMVNPVYLVQKGTMGIGKAATLMVRNLIANHVRAFWPEPWIDRWGRLRGNWIGLSQIVRGKIDPSEISRLK